MILFISVNNHCITIMIVLFSLSLRPTVVEVFMKCLMTHNQPSLHVSSLYTVYCYKIIVTMFHFGIHLYVHNRDVSIALEMVRSGQWETLVLLGSALITPVVFHCSSLVEMITGNVYPLEVDLTSLPSLWRIATYVQMLKFALFFIAWVLLLYLWKVCVLYHAYKVWE